MGDPVVDLKEEMAEMERRRLDGGWLYRRCQHALDSGDETSVKNALHQVRCNRTAGAW